MENAEVRFTLSEADYVEFHQYAFRHVPLIRKRAIALIILITGLAELALLGGTQIILTHPFFTHDKQYCANAVTMVQLGAAIIGLFAFSVTSYLGYNHLYPKSAFRTLQKQKHPLAQERTVTLEPEGIKTSGAGRETLYSWDSLAKQPLKESTNLLIIFVDNTTGLIIPKKAFGSTEEQQYFWKQVQEYAKPAE